MAVFRVVLYQTLFDQGINNTFAFETREGSADTGEADLFSRFDSFLQAAWRLPFSTDLKYNLIDVRQLDTADPLAYQQAPVAVSGAIATQAGNPAEAVILSLKSVYADRRRNGRLYLAGLPGAYMAQGRVPPGVGLTNLQNLVSAISSLWGPNGSEPYRLGIWSDPPVSAKFPVKRAPFFTPYAQIRINLITGSQRRRRIGVGV